MRTIFLCLTLALNCALAQYTITDLGPCIQSSGGGTFGPLGINNRGEVAGAYITPSGLMHAYLWLPQAAYGLPAGLNDLGTLTPGHESSANDINDSGRIVGRSGFQLLATGSSRVFMWEPQQGMRDIGTIAGKQEGNVTRINNAGQAVGTAENYSGDPDTRAALWSNGTVVDLGALLTNPASGALGINNAGAVVGVSVGPGVGNAFLWTPNTPNGNVGVVTYLGNFSPNRINAAGQLAGIYFSVNGELHPFFYANGQVQDLGTLGGGFGSAEGLNDFGQVVGASNVSSGEPHAFLYDGTALRDLNAMIPQNSGWVLHGARAINNLGQIVGYGSFGGLYHGFVLTPGPTPGHKACLFYDSTKAVNSGATLPIKIQYCNLADQNQSSPSIVAKAVSITQVSTSISGPVQSAGNANPDSNFRFDATIGGSGGYIYNLSTKGMATGRYNLNVTFTGDVQTYALPFQVK